MSLGILGVGNPITAILKGVYFDGSMELRNQNHKKEGQHAPEREPKVVNMLRNPGGNSALGGQQPPERHSKHTMKKFSSSEIILDLLGQHPPEYSLVLPNKT